MATVSRPARRRFGRVLPGLLLLAACDYPTALPKWSTTWDLPVKTAQISIASLLPAGVAVSPDSQAFIVDVNGVSFTQTLGGDCNACAVNSGFTIPKPAFSVVDSEVTPVNSQLVQADVTGDTLVMQVYNGFNFDPLRPSANTTGQIYVLVTNGLTTIATDTVDGAAQSMPVGATFTHKIALSGAINGAQPLQVKFVLNSPAGDAVQMRSADTVSMSAFVLSSAANELRVNAPVLVRLTSQSINSNPTDLDLSNTDSSIANHVESGTLRLSITNPFLVNGSTSVSLTAPHVVPVTKNFTLSAAPSSTEDITFSHADLKSLIGHDVTLNMNGVVCANGCNVSISPKQVVSLSARLIMTINTAKVP